MDLPKSTLLLVLGLLLAVVAGSVLDGGLRVVVQVVGVVCLLLAVAVLAGRASRPGPGAPGSGVTGGSRDTGRSEGMWLPSRDEEPR